MGKTCNTLKSICFRANTVGEIFALVPLFSYSLLKSVQVTVEGQVSAPEILEYDVIPGITCNKGVDHTSCTSIKLIQTHSVSCETKQNNQVLFYGNLHR